MPSNLACIFKDMVNPCQSCSLFAHDFHPFLQPSLCRPHPASQGTTNQSSKALPETAHTDGHVQASFTPLSCIENMFVIVFLRLPTGSYPHVVNKG